MKRPFKIDHIDPLGQGVAKERDGVTFIPKTLPGEEGQAVLMKKKKKVNFALLKKTEDLTLASPERISPACPHFQECPSCHYLHTSYDQEKKYKKEVFRRLLALASRKNPQAIPESVEVGEKWAAHRFQYRNRIQLHYDLEKRKLGYYHSLLQEIVQVPQCLLPLLPLQKAMQELYHQNRWMKEAADSSSSPQGHVELYAQEESQIQITWNQPYAAGGFSQINREMNEILREEVGTSFHSLFPPAHSREKTRVVDLFGGDGNLSRFFQGSLVSVVDSFVPLEKLQDHQKGLKLNLYGARALATLRSEIRESVDFFLVNPPRGGLPLLDDFLQTFLPRHFFYISCNPQTLFRDLSTLQGNYQIQKATLFDMFPSTYHFETLVWGKLQG